jgi:predicted dienelactone hydrolase
MRLFEWLLFLALLTALLIPQFPLAWRRRWLIGAAGWAPVAAAALHLSLEGWRIQMLPLYALAALLPLRVLRRGRTPPRRPVVAAAALTALLLLGLLPGWAMPVVALPKPTGPYHVGLVDRELADETRGRRLMVSVWYPATRAGDPAPLFRHPREVAAGLASAFELPAAAPLLQHLRYSVVAATEAAPTLSERAPFPVLVFSHGLVGLRTQNSSSFQELASWGYVVVALDHTDAAAVTVFPDGEARRFDLRRFGIGPDDVERSTEVLLPVWVADQHFVYDTLERWAASDPLFAGALDLERIGSFGHSFGGVTAIESCRVDARCRAAVNLDGGFGERVPEPAARPVLIMSAASSNRFADATRGWSQLVREASGPAYWLELPDSNHYAFTIAPLISPLLAPPGADPRASLGVVDKYLRAFFGLYLLGQDAGLLGPESGKTDVRWRSE